MTLENSQLIKYDSRNGLVWRSWNDFNINSNRLRERFDHKGSFKVTSKENILII